MMEVAFPLVGVITADARADVTTQTFCGQVDVHVVLSALNVLSRLTLSSEKEIRIVSGYTFCLLLSLHIVT